MTRHHTSEARASLNPNASRSCSSSDSVSFARRARRAGRVRTQRNRAAEGQDAPARGLPPQGSAGLHFPAKGPGGPGAHGPRSPSGPRLPCSPGLNTCAHGAGQGKCVVPPAPPPGPPGALSSPSRRARDGWATSRTGSLRFCTTTLAFLSGRQGSPGLARKRASTRPNAASRRGPGPAGAGFGGRTTKRLGLTQPPSPHHSGRPGPFQPPFSSLPGPLFPPCLFRPHQSPSGQAPAASPGLLLASRAASLQPHPETRLHAAAGPSRQRGRRN